VDGQTKSCGTDTGECQSGTQTCTGGIWGACVGEVAPATELCDGRDNDCDGEVDNGVCSQPDSCNETDGGYGFGLKGTVSGFKDGEYYTYIDYCVDSSILKEYFCTMSASVYGSLDFACAGNFTGCVDGACT
ncbi:putative metal-binding motif-containing protein, partial [Candidatus Woesearchaeota archaeon]|nr:putative metal-binding motif-containing protein [Candidatus Woesearchaeota archaeon]